MVGIDLKDRACSHDAFGSPTLGQFWFYLQLVLLSEAFRDSEVFLSSLMTADRASGLMPCSQSLTHIDRDSMSKPVFRSLEISSSTSIVSRTAFRFALAALAIAMNENC